LNAKPARIDNHGYNEPKKLYHENVKILDLRIKEVWKDEREEMRV
jgi:hypothetical protein